MRYAASAYAPMHTNVFLLRELVDIYSNQEDMTLKCAFESWSANPITRNQNLWT